LKNIVLLLFCGFLIIQCKEATAPKYVLPPNPATLISSDSTKIWKLAKRLNNGHRMNMGDCFLSFRMIFNNDKTMRDNNEENMNCGKSIRGTWKITENEIAHYIKISSPLIPEILNTKDSFKYFKILNLTDSLLILEFSHKQFSNKTSIITDHLVPENVHVENRNFHY